jgi:hypothetical protein
MGRELLLNYMKRTFFNSRDYHYQGPLVSRLTQMCYLAMPASSNKDKPNEINFWLYTQMCEHIGFETDDLEFLVKVFRKILEFIDKTICDLLGNIIDEFFTKNFMNNF